MNDNMKQYFSNTPSPEIAKNDTSDNNASDNVNHPSHYTYGKIEVIDYIEDKQLGFCLGNAVKYISRAGKKIREFERCGERDRRFEKGCMVY